MHVLREIAGRKAGDDAAGLVDAAVDAIDKLVEAGGKPVQVGIAVVLVDPLCEITGSGGRHDDSDARLQIGALFTQRAFLGIQFAHGQAIALEHFDGTGHLADFVLAAGKRHIGAEVAIGKLLHRAGQLQDRLAELLWCRYRRLFPRR